MTLNMILGQPCCICIKEDNFDLKGSETGVTWIFSNRGRGGGGGGGGGKNRMFSIVLT